METPSASLLTVLADATTKRYLASLDIEAKREELSLKRHEIDVQNAEALQKAANLEREAKAELREKKKLWARENPGHNVPKNKGSLACRVCENPSEASLSAPEIVWHRAGHPNQAPDMAELWS